MLSFSLNDMDRNLELAFSTAEHYLGVAPLIEVEDVLFHDFPDQFSVMTYVAQFHSLFYKPFNGNASQ